MTTPTNQINNSNFSTWIISSFNSSAKKVNDFFSANKNHFFSFTQNAYNSGKEKCKNFYMTYSQKVKVFFMENIDPIIFSVAASALFYNLPILTILGAITGFIINPKTVEYERNTSSNKIFTPINTALAAIGTIGLIIPTCSLSVFAIIIGTIGLGKTINNIYTSIIASPLENN